MGFLVTVRKIPRNEVLIVCKQFAESLSWSIPYPTWMIFVGVAIAFVPGLPNVQLTPDIVFLIFLPPLLFAATWQTPFHDFRKTLRPTALLAFGLVLVTTLVVGGVAHHRRVLSTKIRARDRHGRKSHQIDL